MRFKTSDFKFKLTFDYGLLLLLNLCLIFKTEEWNLRYLE